MRPPPRGALPSPASTPICSDPAWVSLGDVPRSPLGSSCLPPTPLHGRFIAKRGKHMTPLISQQFAPPGAALEPLKQRAKMAFQQGARAVVGAWLCALASGAWRLVLCRELQYSAEYRIHGIRKQVPAQAPDGLGKGASGQPGIPATPPDHQIDQQRCDRASFQAGSPCSQPPLTVCISPRARSHAAWRIAHYDQCVSYTRRAARPGQSAGE